MKVKNFKGRVVGAVALAGISACNSPNTDNSSNVVTNLVLEQNKQDKAIVTESDIFFDKFNTKSVTLPSVYDMSNLMPGIRNQGTTFNSCQSFAIVNVVGYLEKIRRNKNVDQNFSFSPAFIYEGYKAIYAPQDQKSCSSGIQTRDALNFLKNQGIVEEKFLPYNLNSNCNRASNINSTLQNNIIKKYKYDFSQVISNNSDKEVNKIKTFLFSGQPLIIGINVPKELSIDKKTFLSEPLIYTGSKHAITLVGYDDKKKDSNNKEVGAFRFMNSWGIEYGEKGFGWISYSAFSNSKLVSDGFRIY